MLGLELLIENEKVTTSDLDMFEANPTQLEDSLVQAKENRINQVYRHNKYLTNNCNLFFSYQFIFIIAASTII